MIETISMHCLTGACSAICQRLKSDRSSSTGTSGLETSHDNKKLPCALWSFLCFVNGWYSVEVDDAIAFALRGLITIIKTRCMIDTGNYCVWNLSVSFIITINFFD